LIPSSVENTCRVSLNCENFYGHEKPTRGCFEITRIFKIVENEIIGKEIYKQYYKKVGDNNFDILRNTLFIYNLDAYLPEKYLKSDQYINFISELENSIEN
jgi:hypothetical protein